MVGEHLVALASPLKSRHKALKFKPNPASNRSATDSELSRGVCRRFEVVTAGGEFDSPQEAELADRAWLRARCWHARRMRRKAFSLWKGLAAEQQAGRRKHERAVRWDP